MSNLPDRILRGVVTKIDANGVYVEVPRLGQGVTFGPCQVVLAPFVNTVTAAVSSTQNGGAHTHTASTSVSTVDGATANTSIGQAPDHAHGLVGGKLALLPGHHVLVTTVNGVKDDLVVLGRLT